MTRWKRLHGTGLVVRAAAAADPHDNEDDDDDDDDGAGVYRRVIKEPSSVDLRC